MVNRKIRSKYKKRKSTFTLLQSHQDFPKFCIVGASNGGMAVAGYLSMAGFPTKLFNRTPEKLDAIRRYKGIMVEGRIKGFASLDTITSDISEAVTDVDVIMVVIPAYGHRTLAKNLAPHLKDGQVIVLNPGRTLGAVEFEHVLRTTGCKSNVIVAETQTMLYASRCVGKAQVKVHGIKNRVPLAALPAWQSERVLQMLNLAFPQFVLERDVLCTGLNNVGAILHPIPTILNLARIDSGKKFKYYHEGISPKVAELLEKVDRERLAVAAAFGIEAESTKEWLKGAYGAEGRTLFDAIQDNPSYKGISAPNTLPTRYITEDVPMGLVPISSLGRLVNISTPVIDNVITLASMVDGVDYRKEGRTLDRVGLGGMTVREIYALILEGREQLSTEVQSV